MNLRCRAVWLLPALLLLVTAIYWPGLSGNWLFDDYPNIVDNPGVQPHEASVPALARAALSSPASEFKRPLASLSFAANYLIDGLNPWGWKLFNLVVHLLNGMLVFWLARTLLSLSLSNPIRAVSAATVSHYLVATEAASIGKAPLHTQTCWVASLVAVGWMLLPINLTAVLYVVQREESIANLFVLLGLIGYTAGRQKMLSPAHEKNSSWMGFWLCAASLVLCAVFGLLAKETAVMLPLYAFLVECTLFGFHRSTPPARTHGAPPRRDLDISIASLFSVVLALPMLIGLFWLLPQVLAPTQWVTRNFTLATRLLTEARIVCDYLAWTLLPTPDALSFYHDQFPISTGLLSPWTTLASLFVLAALAALVWKLRQRQPLVALGIALYLGCHLLTGTILPLELVYEHRNYFASFGLMLAAVPWLAGWTGRKTLLPQADELSALAQPQPQRTWTWPRRILLALLMLWWAGATAITAYAWGEPLRLAQELAERAPDSPRAQYELGRTYIIYSHYDPASPFTALAYAPLEQAAALPGSSILPQQALIFMNSRMGRPLEAPWWDSMIAKLKSRPPGVQDESSLGTLVRCARESACPLPAAHMVAALEAALSHPHSSARLQAIYGDYAWNVLDDYPLGLRMTAAAVATNPQEPAYHITLARMLAAQGRYAEVEKQIQALQTLNIGGRLDRDITGVRALIPPASAR